MRRSMVVVAVLAAGILAGQPADADEAKKYHTVDAEVVSADVDSLTLTVRVDGRERTEPVSRLAKSRLGEVKPGEKVVLSCKDVGGEHREVVAIRPAASSRE